jgi:hypothetical protein
LDKNTEVDSRIREAMQRMQEAANVTMTVEVAGGEDSRSEPTLVDSTTTAQNLVDGYVSNNNLPPSVRFGMWEWWPEPPLQRLLMRHELVVDVVRTWPRSHVGNRFIVRPMPADIRLDDTEVTGAKVVDPLEFPDFRGYLQMRVKGKSWSERFMMMGMSGLMLYKSMPATPKETETPWFESTIVGMRAYWYRAELKKAPHKYVIILRPPPTAELGRPLNMLWPAGMSDVKDELENVCLWISTGAFTLQ